MPKAPEHQAPHNRFAHTLVRGEFPRPVAPKHLRHTYGNLMVINRQFPLHIVRTQMGHTDIKTTMQYVQPSTARPHVAKFATLISPKTRRSLPETKP